jgi:hypothetical protein
MDNKSSYTPLSGDLSFDNTEDHCHDNDHSLVKTKSCCSSGECRKKETPLQNHDEHSHVHQHSCCKGNEGSEHDHNHHGESKFDFLEDDDCCDEGCGCVETKESATFANHDHDHDHRHSGHEFQSLDDCDEGCGCCPHEENKSLLPTSASSSSSSCCSSSSAQVDHNHNHDHQLKSPSFSHVLTPAEVTTPPVTVARQIELTSTKQLTHEVIMESQSPLTSLEKMVCSFCDPTSSVEHAIQITRLRVANLCCIKEEQILRKELAGMNGIEHVSVNLIGKYAIIKHCNVECCAPGHKIVEMLNDKHLGVSIQDINHSSNDGISEHVDRYQLIHCFIVTLLFFLGFIFQFI